MLLLYVRALRIGLAMRIELGLFSQRKTLQARFTQLFHLQLAARTTARPADTYRDLDLAPESLDVPQHIQRPQ